MDEGFRVRQQAAHEPVVAGEIDGMTALSYIVDPSPELEAWSIEVGRHGRWTDRQRDQACALAAQGLSQRQIALEVCGSARFRTTIATWLRQPACSQGSQTSRPAR